MSREVRRGLLDDLRVLNEAKFAEVGDPEIVTRIAQYEMAYKMQASVPELTDFSTEPKHGLESYGPDVIRRGSFAYNCLMARRLVVRFVQCFHAGWDHHRNLSTQFFQPATMTNGVGWPASAVCSRVPNGESQDGRGRPSYAPRWSKSSSSAACSTTRWSSGAASSVALRSEKGT
jgi:uncharacterized protein DUF1501